VRKRLRRVAGLVTRARVGLLGEEAEVGAVREDAVHELGRVDEPPGVRVLLDEPERAGEEGVLVAGHAVDLGLGAIAANEPVAEQGLLDAGDRAEHAGIVVGDVSDLRELQQRGIHLRRALVLHVRAER
jgi:hypothetical protein